MANLNRVHLIGRLTRDVETKTFNNGGKVAKLGFATNNRKKNSSGEWVDDPVFLDVKAFNRENGRKLADLCEEYLHKGDQCYIEGHLVMESWDKDGETQRKLLVYLDDVQFLTPKGESGQQQNKPANGTKPAQQSRRPAAPPPEDVPEDDEEEIPF